MIYLYNQNKEFAIGDHAIRGTIDTYLVKRIHIHSYNFSRR